MKLMLQQIQILKDPSKTGNEEAEEGVSLKKERSQQLDMFKQPGGMHIIRKFVQGTEEEAKKWQSPKDWADWSLERVKEAGQEKYKVWVLFFFCCWAKEVLTNKTDPDQGLVFKVRTSNFWKEMTNFPNLHFKITDISISRRMLYKIRQITGFPEYRGRMDLIKKWKKN